MLFVYFYNNSVKKLQNTFGVCLYLKNIFKFSLLSCNFTKNNSTKNGIFHINSMKVLIKFYNCYFIENLGNDVTLGLILCKSFNLTNCKFIRNSNYLKIVKIIEETVLINFKHFSMGCFVNCSAINNLQKRGLFLFSEKLAKQSKILILYCELIINKAYQGGGFEFLQATNRSVVIKLCLFIENESKFYGPTISISMPFKFIFKKHNLTLLNHLCLRNLAYGGICCIHNVYQNNSYFNIINSIMKSNIGNKRFSIGCALQILSAVEKYVVVISRNNIFQENECVNSQFYCFGFIKYIDIGGFFFENKIQDQAGIFFLTYQANVSLFQSILKKNTARYSAIVLAYKGSILYVYNISIEDCYTEIRFFAFSQKSYFIVDGMTLKNSTMQNKEGRIFDLKNAKVSIKNLIFNSLNKGIIFLIEIVQISLKKSIFSNYKNLFLKATTANILISNCSIQNSIIYKISKSCVFQVRENSDIKLFKVIYKNISCNYCNFLISIETSPLHAENNIFNNIFSKISCGIFSSFVSRVIVKNSIFKNFNTFGFYLNRLSKLFFQNNFLENKKEFAIKNNFFECIFCIKILIKSNSFNLIGSLKSGTILNIKNVNSTGSYLVQNSRFYKCKSHKFGGVFAINDGFLNIFNSFFIKNSAIRGGVFYYFCSLKKKLICSLNLTKNLFSSNIALINGGVIYWKYVQPILLSNILVNNSAKYGSDFSSFYLTINFSVIKQKNGRIEYISNLNRSLYIVNNTSPLKKIPFSFEFSLLDVYQQKIKEILLSLRMKIELDLLIKRNFESLNISRKILKKLLLKNNSDSSLYENKKPYIFGKLYERQSENFNFLLDQIYTIGTPLTTIYLKFSLNKKNEYKKKRIH